MMKEGKFDRIRVLW